MKTTRQSIHYAVFLFAMALLLTGLCVSKFLASLGGMILALNWILEGQFKQKLQRLKANKPALLILGLFALHLIWLWNTSNFEYALKDIRIKLPLLFLPVVLGTGKPLSRKTVMALLWLFVAALFAGTVLSLIHYFTHHNPAVDNIRQIIFYSSPIRFAILLVLGMAFVFYAYWAGRLNGWLAIAIGLWFLAFLAFLQSLTGLFMVVALASVLLIVSAWKKRRQPIGIIGLLLPAVFWGALGWILFNGYQTFTTPVDSPLNSPPWKTHSYSGEAYEHHPENGELQNGYYIYRYVAKEELGKAWERATNTSLDTTDARGQRLRHTLIRYMASLGLTKDSIGFAALSEKDIEHVKLGFTNAHPSANPLERRVKSTYFEINSFREGGRVQGGSVVQRWIYWKTGWEVVRENWLFVVGTGDVNDAIQDEYNRQLSPLEPEYRRRAHNQYLTFWISFGIFGALYFLALNVWSLVFAFRSLNYMAMAFVLLAALSFVAEDTLETQVGATFYALFYALFLCQKIETSAGQKFGFNEFRGDVVNRRALK